MEGIEVNSSFSHKGVADLRSSTTSQKYKLLIDEIDNKSKNLITRSKRNTSEAGESSYRPKWLKMVFNLYYNKLVYHI